jgi:branched-chain amino acid aminotransferase
MQQRRPFPEGEGIFETLRTQNGEVAELTRHMRRALSAAQALNISMPDEEVLRSEIAAAMLLQPFELGRLRICLSNQGFSVSHDSYEEIETFARLTFHSTSSPAVGEQFKTYPYDWHYQVVDEARDYGFDDAILFNAKNEVTETGLSNLLFKIDGSWVTPPISAGILPGIMRGIAIDRCGVSVRAVHISQIPRIESAFLLGSLKIAQPVSYIGDYALRMDQEVLALEAKMRAAVEYFSVL